MLKDRLREARKLKGYTQEKLASAIGVKKSTVCGYESGNSEPDMAKMMLIMDVLEIDANFLFQDEIAQKTMPSDSAMLVARKYDELDSIGQELIEDVFRVALKYHSINQANDSELGVYTSGQTTQPYQFLHREE